MCFQACKLWDSFQCLLKYSPPHVPKQAIWKDIENDYVSVEWMRYYRYYSCCVLQTSGGYADITVLEVQKLTNQHFLHSCLHSAIGICSLARHWPIYFVLLFIRMVVFLIHGRFFTQCLPKTMWPRSAASSLHFCHISSHCFNSSLPVKCVVKKFYPTPWPVPDLSTSSASLNLFANNSFCYTWLQ